MSKEIVFNCTEYETRIAIMENRALSNFYVERLDQRSITGNIYKGKVVRIVPGISAAFIDIGLDRTAFLYLPDNDQLLYQKAAYPKNSGISLSEAEIQPVLENLKQDQDIIVQVSKEPLGTKGAQVTANISLPGRNIVLMPKSTHIGISKKITDTHERERLSIIIEKLSSKKYGFIARTASEGKPEDDLQVDFDYLCNLWQTIAEKGKRTSAPCILYRDLDITLRAIRDLYTQDVEKIIIDSEEEYSKAVDFMGSFMPHTKNAVSLYQDSVPIFDHLGISLDINRMLQKKVWLKSGGYIIIEETEALCAIDVNTGKYLGKKNIEDTVLKTNLEAVKEIAYQLRTRNIGGIIIIDFIDMAMESSRGRVFDALTEEMEKDRSKTKIQRISEIGLIEMTRQKRRKSLSDTMCEACPSCSGTGRVKSKMSVCYDILRKLEKDFLYSSVDTISVAVHPEVEKILIKDKNDYLKKLENRLGKKIAVKGDRNIEQEKFEIISD